MKSARLLFVALLVFLVGGARDASAQAGVPRDTTITHVLYLVDGSTLVGRLISRDSATVQFETNGGMLTVPVARVKELRTVAPAEIRGNEYWFPDANETRLFFAPTGRMLKKGEGYYSNTYLLLQNFVGAPTDKFTFGGGFSIIPGDNFFEQNVYYLTPKLGIYNTPKTNVAVGTLIGMIPFDNNADSFGILYGVATRGGPDASITAGMGYGFQNGDLQDRPLFMLGGAARASRRLSFVTENYLAWMEDEEYLGCTGGSCQYRTRTRFEGLLSYGLRFMGEKVSTDFALLNAMSEFIFPGIPYIAFAVKF